MSQWLIAIPFLAQGAAMAVDEFYFHSRRGLGRWERLGHPVDTLAFLACFAIVGSGAPTVGRFYTFVACSAFSTLLITKDEWVHAKECPPGEHWLHAMLFVLHPVVLFATGWLWPSLVVDGSPLRMVWVSYVGGVALFFAYQVVRWNLFHDRNPVHQQRDLQRAR